MGCAASRNGCKMAVALRVAMRDSGSTNATADQSMSCKKKSAINTVKKKREEGRI